jgi:hypothetical protein
MANFSDLMDRLHVPAFFMKKNPSPLDSLKEDLQMIFVIFAIYLGSYFYGNHTLCLLAMTSMNIQFFQVGTNFHKLLTSVKASDMSCKQKEQGASVANPMTVEQNNLVNEQLQQVVRDTLLRNLNRNPSSTSIVNDEFDDMPPLIPVNETVLRNSLTYPFDKENDDFGQHTSLISADKQESVGFPYSENHYLRGHVTEID